GELRKDVREREDAAKDQQEQLDRNRQETALQAKKKANQLEITEAKRQAAQAKKAAARKAKDDQMERIRLLRAEVLAQENDIMELRAAAAASVSVTSAPASSR
ncbi:unnamed protein product, partial [Pylaiella littoralis]